EEIAVEHRRGLHERLAEAHRRDFHREAACLPDAALHLLGAGAEMRMTGVELAPGVDDRDHRLPGIILGREPPLLRARAMPERAQVLRCQPPRAPQLLVAFFHRGREWLATQAVSTRGPILV